MLQSPRATPLQIEKCRLHALKRKNGFTCYPARVEKPIAANGTCFWHGRWLPECWYRLFSG